VKESAGIKKERRHDIDWVRVLAFDLLILFHVGMFFVPWKWHIKNNELTEVLVLPMYFLSQWRLPILFLVSGMGTRYALSFRTAKDFIVERSVRLLIPLVFGMLVLIAPQVYFERRVQAGYNISYFDFYPSFFDGIYPEGNFSWHHLWFLPYLFLFSIVLTPFFIFLRDRAKNDFFLKIQILLQRHPSLIYALTVPLIVVEFFLQPFFPVNYSVIGDWYALAFYIQFFLYGYLFIMLKEVIWDVVAKIKWISLAGGMALFPALIVLQQNHVSHIFQVIVKTLNIWSWILVVLGFSSQFLNKPSSILKYRNEAVYPFYILHQTVTVIIGFYLMDMELTVAKKFALLTFGTLLVVWLLYELIIRRIQLFRLIFGLKSDFF
jgi:hypothetical protein